MSGFELICRWPVRTIVVSPPATTAITKEFARIQAGRESTDTSVDALLDVYIPAATKMAQDWTGKTFITTEYQAFWDCFPACLTMLAAPLFTITAFKYTDIDEVEQDLAADQYEVSLNDHYASVYPVSSFPATDNIPEAVRLSYTAGFGINDTFVPDDIKLAIAMMTTSMLENRGDCSDDCGFIPCGAQRLLMAYRPGYAINAAC